jgi:hypothetical protein
LTWYNDDTGEELGTGTSVVIPLEPACYQFNGSVRYYDEIQERWVICCISIWICDPYDCFDITYAFNGSNAFELTFTGNGTNLTWYNDDTGEELGSGTSILIPIVDPCVWYTATLRYYDNICGCWRICCITFWLCPEDFCCEGDPLTFPWLQNLLTELSEEYFIGCGGVKVYCCLYQGQPYLDVQHIPENSNCGYPAGTVYNCEGNILFSWGGPTEQNIVLHNELSNCIQLWECSDEPICIPEEFDPDNCDLFIYQTYPIQNEDSYELVLTNTTGYDVFMYILYDGDTNLPIDTLYPATTPGSGQEVMICPGPGNYWVCTFFFCEEECFCPQIWDPVCVIGPGGNIITFPNECQAFCAGYDANNFVSCEPNCYCPIQVWDPVCVVGPGGFIITFPNECSANCAGYYTNDFVPCTNCYCTLEYDPVCVVGPNGNIITFPNECQANCAGYNANDFVPCNDCECPGYINPVCVVNTPGDTITFQNACFAICAGYSPFEYFFCDGTTCVCPAVYDPVCVLVNGEILEFSNDCFAICAGFEISDFVECPQDCICPDVIDPVCVFDNGQIIEFGNACEAYCAGYFDTDFVPCNGTLFSCCKSFCVGCENESCVENPLFNLPWIYQYLLAHDYENVCCPSGADPKVERCWFNGQCVYHFTECVFDDNGYVFDWQGNLIFSYNGFSGYNIHLASQLENCIEIWNCSMGIPYVVEFDIGEECGPTGTIVEVPIFVRNFIDVAGFQFSLHVEDPSVAGIVGFSDFVIPVGTLSFYGGAQTRTAVWDDPTAIGVTLPDSTILFKVQLLITGNGGQSSALTIDGAPTAFVVGNSNSTQLPAISFEGSICVSENATIAGNIYKTNGQMVALAEVELSGDASALYVTDASGYYEFSNLPIGGDYWVTPEKDINYVNGVNVLDITRIRQHILGSIPFTSPYQFIAGDATNDQLVNVLDITQIRQLILGAITDFPNNTSWQFVPTNYVFPNPSNPLSSPFPEERSYLPLNSDRINEDFFAVKIGDVNNDSNPLNFTTGMEDREMPTKAFVIREKKAESDKQIAVTFLASSFEEITGFQFSLRYDKEVLEYTDVIGLNLSGFTAATFHHMAEKGVITFAWTDPDAQPNTRKNGEELFKVIFLAKESGKSLSDVISKAETPTEPWIFDKSGQGMDLQLEFLDQPANDSQLLVTPPRPNPFKDQTTISYLLPYSDDIFLEVFDLNGRLVHTEAVGSSAGFQQFVIKGVDIPGPGLYFIRIHTSKDTVAFRLIQQ